MHATRGESRSWGSKGVRATIVEGDAIQQQSAPAGRGSPGRRLEKMCKVCGEVGHYARRHPTYGKLWIES